MPRKWGILEDKCNSHSPSVFEPSVSTVVCASTYSFRTDVKKKFPFSWVTQFLVSTWNNQPTIWFAKQPGRHLEWNVCFSRYIGLNCTVVSPGYIERTDAWWSSICATTVVIYILAISTWFIWLGSDKSLATNLGNSLWRRRCNYVIPASQCKRCLLYTSRCV